jgi:hypothetical protein
MMGPNLKKMMRKGKTPSKVNATGNLLKRALYLPALGSVGLFGLWEQANGGPLDGAEGRKLAGGCCNSTDQNTHTRGPEDGNAPKKENPKVDNPKENPQEPDYQELNGALDKFNNQKEQTLKTEQDNQKEQMLKTKEKEEINKESLISKRNSFVGWNAGQQPQDLTEDQYWAQQEQHLVQAKQEFQQQKNSMQYGMPQTQLQPQMQQMHQHMNMQQMMPPQGNMDMNMGMNMGFSNAPQGMPLPPILEPMGNFASSESLDPATVKIGLIEEVLAMRNQIMNAGKGHLFSEVEELRK